MGSAEMTDSIWGKISQLNAGEMPLPRLLLLHGSCGTSSLQMISDCQSYQIYFFFPCRGSWGYIARKIQVRDRGYEFRRWSEEGLWEGWITALLPSITQGWLIPVGLWDKKTKPRFFVPHRWTHHCSFWRLILHLLSLHKQPLRIYFLYLHLL